MSALPNTLRLWGFSENEVAVLLSDPDIKGTTMPQVVMNLHARVIKAEGTIQKAREVVEKQKRSSFWSLWL
jgi:hypothetical protein